jgi:hypothetical protein
VALGARISGRAPDGRPWSLQLATVHLDTLAGASRLWVFAHWWRARQAQTVIDALDGDDPSVLGGDLNTWLLGSWESATRRFAAAYPQTRTAVTPAGASAHGRLDYLFFRLPPRWASEVRKLQDRIGSDHAPLVGAVRVALADATEPDRAMQADTAAASSALMPGVRPPSVGGGGGRDYLAGRGAVTVSGARSRMLSEEAPTPMSNTPGSTADPIEPP